MSVGASIVHIAGIVSLVMSIIWMATLSRRDRYSPADEPRAVRHAVDRTEIAIGTHGECQLTCGSGAARR
jgi:hypothetical protein